MPNHHEKDLTAVLVKGSQPPKKPRLPVTLAEGSRTVKLTTPFRLPLWSGPRRRSGRCRSRSRFKPSMKKNRHRPIAVVSRDETGLFDLLARDAV